MQTKLNRRQWLANTTLTSTALAVISGRGLAQSPSSKGDLIKLDQNENPYGISPKVEAAIASAVRAANRYPMRELGALRDLIAEREQVSSDSVILGSGCTEIFSLACLRYGADGKAVLAAEPTYAGFEGYIQHVRGQLVRVPVNSRWETDLDAIAQRETKNTSFVYICNPNNPTATINDGTRLRQF